MFITLQWTSSIPTHQTLQPQTANCIWITFCFLAMSDMKKNERHQELIIKSSFPALQVPEKDLYLRRACRHAAGCHGAVGAGCRPRLAASYSIPGNWDQMLPLSGTWTGSNLEAFILWRRCLVKPCSRSKWASVRLWWWIRLVKALKAGSWLLPSPPDRVTD